MDTGDRVLPFVRRFYGQPSLHIWEDKVGEVQDIPQGEGGDQGDPLMPLLFSLAVHPSLVSTGNLLREGEKLLAFLDDVYLVCKPERVLEVFRLIENTLWVHSRISVHCGKTQLGTAVGPHLEDVRNSPELPGPRTQKHSRRDRSCDARLRDSPSSRPSLSECCSFVVSICPPPSLSSRNCQCGRPLDCLGHHRSACAIAGVLGRSGLAVESAIARAGFGPQSVQMGCHCLVGPSWPPTQLWFQTCVGTAPQGKAQPIAMAWLSGRHTDERIGLTLNSLVKGSCSVGHPC